MGNKQISGAQPNDRPPSPHSSNNIEIGQASSPHQQRYKAFNANSPSHLFRNHLLPFIFTTYVAHEFLAYRHLIFIAPVALFHLFCYIRVKFSPFPMVLFLIICSRMEREEGIRL